MRVHELCMLLLCASACPVCMRMTSIAWPAGVASELSMVCLAWPRLRDDKPFSIDMPNPFNWAFDYRVAVWVIVAMYLPGTTVHSHAVVRHTLAQTYFLQLA
jgi:hypothetical protein